VDHYGTDGKTFIVTIRFPLRVLMSNLMAAITGYAGRPFPVIYNSRFVACKFKKSVGF